VLTGLPAVTGAATAAAIAPAPVVVFVADTNNDDWYGLYKMAPNHTGVTAILPERAGRDVGRAKISPSGKQVALQLADGSPDYSLVVMNLDGTGRHVVARASETASSATYIHGFSWLANSQRLVYGYEVETAASFTTSLRLANANGAPAPATVRGSQGAHRPGGAWGRPVHRGARRRDRPDHVAQPGDRRAPRAEQRVGRSASGVVARRLDRRVVARARAQPPGRGDLGDPAEALDRGRGTRRLVGHQRAGQPVAVVLARRTRIWFDRYQSPTAYRGDLYSIAASLKTSVVNHTATPTVDEGSASIAVPDTTAPGVATPRPFTLNGSQITLRWTNPADRDFYRTAVWRRAAGSTTNVLVYNGAGTSFTDTGRAVGATYTYTFRAYDGAKNFGAATTRDVTALAAPRVRGPNPTALGTTGLPFPMYWGTSNPAGTRYNVRYIAVAPTAAVGPSKPWLTNTTATSAAFGIGGQPEEVRRAWTYYTLAEAHDTHGNSTGYRIGGVTVPYDNTNTAFTAGWLHQRLSNRWLQSLHYTRTAGAYRSLIAHSSGFVVIGDKCPTCGPIRIYIDNRPVATGRHRGADDAGPPGPVALAAVGLWATPGQGHRGAQ
jgi:hypothetical protein